MLNPKPGNIWVSVSGISVTGIGACVGEGAGDEMDAGFGVGVVVVGSDPPQAARTRGVHSAHHIIATPLNAISPSSRQVK